MFKIVFSIVLLLSSRMEARQQEFPFVERFDTVTPPALPTGWFTSAARSQEGDFTTTVSSPHSPPNAVIGINATIEQYLQSPLFDFTNLEGDSVSFSERRSGTHNASLLITASTDGGVSYPISVGDTLYPGQPNSYSVRAIALPHTLSGRAKVRIRWCTAGNGSGSTGTIRFDNILISARYLRDAALTGIRVMERSADTLHVETAVHNIGVEAIENVWIEWYLDGNHDNFLQTEEFIGRSMTSRVIPPGDREEITGRYIVPAAGSTTIAALCILPGDLNARNDTAFNTMRPPVPRSTVIINEILYEPRAGCSEFIELFNRSGTPLTIDGWRITDDRNIPPDEGGFAIGTLPSIIPSQGYLVIAADTTIRRQFPLIALEDSSVIILGKNTLGLNNEGDAVIVRGASGETIDSVRYYPGWHNPGIDETNGRSLERVNPDLDGNDHRNWTTSIHRSGGTPGMRNSVHTALPAGGGALTFGPNPFSPDGDGHEDLTVIHYSLPESGNLIRVRIFDSQGRQVRTLAESEPSGTGGQFVWDGMDDRRMKVRIGPYIVLLEAIVAWSGATTVLKGVVVVAARL